MRKTDAVIAEIHALVDEQEMLLKSKLTPDEVLQYATRKIRIDELLRQLSKGKP